MFLSIQQAFGDNYKWCLIDKKKPVHLIGIFNIWVWLELCTLVNLLFGLKEEMKDEWYMLVS